MKDSYIPNVKFNLRSLKEKNKETPINAVVHFYYNRIVISRIGKIKPKDWETNPNHKKYNSPKPGVANDGIRLLLTNTEASIVNAFKDIVEKLGHRPESPNEINQFRELCKSRIQGLPDEIQNEDKPKSDSLIKYIEQYIKEADPEQWKEDPAMNKRRFNIRGTDKDYTKRSRQGWTSLLNQLKEFAIYQGTKDIKFIDINQDFYKMFKDFQTQKGISQNYFGTFIKNLKKFMNESMKEKYHTNTEHTNTNFVKSKAKADGKALTVNQLRSLALFDFSDNTRYENARDFFLVGCWTGLRHSDYSRLTRRNISEEDQIIDIVQKKTGTPVSVPILPELKKILNKYKDTTTGFPREISEVKLNEYIKEICKIVGENSDSSFLELHRSKVERLNGTDIEELPLYKLISTHVGRRSFATNAIRLKIPSEFVKKITGHKTDSAFWEYVKINSRESAKLALKAYLDHQTEMEGINND